MMAKLQHKKEAEATSWFSKKPQIMSQTTAFFTSQWLHNNIVKSDSL